MTESWTIYRSRDDLIVAEISDADDEDSKSTLGRLLSLWTRDRDASRWKDSDDLSNIAFFWSDLTERQIEQIFGSPTREFPGSPPWEVIVDDDHHLIRNE